MKRLLSFTLILGMMLTLVGIVPAAAEEAAAEYPYMSLSFDAAGDTSAVSSVGAYTKEWSEEGVAGSKGSLYMTMTGEQGDFHMPITCPEILIGRKAKISCWIKLDTTRTKVKNDSVKMLLWGKTATTTENNAYRFDWDTTAPKPFNNGEWVKIEYIVDNWDGTMSSDKDKLDLSKTVTFTPRIGGLGGSGKLGDAVAEDSPENVLAFWMDEVRVEPIPSEEEEVIVDENILFFDSGTDGKKVGGGKVTWNSGTGCDGQPGYMSFSSVDSDKVYSDMTTPTLNIRYNTLYKVSLWAKADDDATIGDFAMFNVMRQSRLDKTYDSSTANPPAPYGDYQQIKFAPNLTGEWQYYECYFKRNVTSFDNKPMSIWFRGGNDQKGRKFSFDNIKVEAVGKAVTNGDFEWLESDIPDPVYTSDDYNSKDDSKRYGTFYGWFDKNATVEASADVRPGSEGAKSAKITTTAADAEINQGIFIENNSDTMFKFWAKGEGDSVGKPIRVKLDRTVPDVAALDVYNTPDVEILDGNDVLTDTWQEYTVRYQPAFTAEGTAESGVIPRLPFMSIVVDGGAEGLTYYLDDITYESYVEAAEYLPPYASDLYLDGFTVPGADVTLSYMLNSRMPNGGVEGTSFVRVVKVLDNGEECTLAIEPCAVLFNYTIPESIGDASLRFDLLIAEDAGDYDVYGDFASLAVRPSVIAPTLGAFDATSQTVTGTLYVENNANEALELFMLVAVYDENDCAVRYQTKAITVAAASAEEIDVPVSTEDVQIDGIGTIQKAKAFVWGGAGELDTDMKAYADVLVVEK